MRTSKFGAYLSRLERKPISFSCAMGCAGTPGLFNALFDSALGRWDKGRKSECACGRRWGLGQTSIFNLCTVDTKHSWTLTVDHIALSASSKIQHRGLKHFSLLTSRHESPVQRWFPSKTCTKLCVNINLLWADDELDLPWSPSPWLKIQSLLKHLYNVLKHWMVLKLTLRHNNQSAAFAVLNQIRMAINFTLQGPLLLIGT